MGEVVRLLADANAFLTKKIEVRLGRSGIQFQGHERKHQTPFHEMIRLVEDILHQLRLVVYPIIYRVSYMPGG